MPNGCDIVSGKLLKFSIPFKQVMLFNGQQLHSREGLIVQITDSNGLQHFAEVSPLPGFSRETLKQATQQLTTLMHTGFTNLSNQTLYPSVQFAIDYLTAAQQKQTEASALQLDKIPLLQGTNQQIIQQYKQLDRPEKVKIKVAKQAAALDIQLVSQLIALNKQIGLRCDANQQWTTQQAAQFMQATDMQNIDYIEEPTADYSSNLALAAQFQCPIALDETLQDPEFIFSPSPWVKAFVIKPSLMGSLVTIKKLLSQAKQANLVVSISASFESAWGITQLTTLASQYQSEFKHPISLGIDTLKYFQPAKLSRVAHLQQDLAHLPCIFNYVAPPPIDYCPVAWYANVCPDQMAIMVKQSAISYRQVDNLVSSLAKQLIAYNLSSGDRLACISENKLMLVMLQFACLRSAIIFCPINPALTERELQSHLATLNEPSIFTTEPHHQHLSTIELTLPDQSTVKHLQKEPRGIKLPKINPQAVCNIIFTSGSSGVAKAVMHNFSNHFYSANASSNTIPLTVDDRNLLSLPIFHISGYATVMRTFLAAATLVIDPQRITVDSLQQHAITHLSLVSTQLYRLLQTPRFNFQHLALKHILLGGSAFPEHLLAELARRGITFHLSYGLSEMSSQVATSTNNTLLLPLKDIELKIVDGQIMLRGKTRFQGYFHRQLATSYLPSSEWFASKDLGSIKQQYLIIEGRQDRLFISGGENIQAEEIEAVLLNAVGIEQAIVVDVEDALYGARPVAFISWRDKPNMTQLTRYVEQQLSSFKRPIAYFPLPDKRSLKFSLQQLRIDAQTYLRQSSRSPHLSFPSC